MTRDNIASLVYILYREKSTNTSVSASTDMITLINEGYTQLMSEVWPDVIETTTQYTVPVTAVTSKTSNTVWDVTSTTSFAAATDVCIYTGNVFNVARIQAVTDSNTLTLVSPGITYAHTAGAIVVPISFIVADTRFIRSMTYQINTATESTVSEILPVTNEDMFRLGYLPKATGTPDKYAPWTVPLTEVRVYPIPTTAGYINMRYGAKSAYTLAESSSSPIIDADAHVGIVYWVMHMLLLRERNFQEAMVFKAMYDYVVLKTRSAIVTRKEKQSKMSLKRGEL